MAISDPAAKATAPVIESRLVGWLKSAFEQYGAGLKGISGSVEQSGEGMWTVQAARELGIPAPVIEKALDFRLQSQKKPSYTGQIVSALRHQFGGHAVSTGEAEGGAAEDTKKRRIA